MRACSAHAEFSQSPFDNGSHHVGQGLVTMPMLEHAFTCILAVSVVLLFAVTQVAAAISNVRRMQKVLEKMPGPKPLPVIGNLLDIFTAPENFWVLMTKLMDTYAPTFCFWLGPAPVVVVTDPHDLDFIMNSAKFNDKSSWYPLAKSTLGSGLIILSGEPWRRHRRAVAPTMHQRVLAHNVEIFYRKALDLASVHLHKRAESGAVFDILEYCNLLSMEAVCETLLSADVSAHREAVRRFVDETCNSARLVTYRVCNPWLLSDRIFALTEQGKESRRIEELTNSFVDSLIDRKRAEGIASHRTPTPGQPTQSQLAPGRSSRRSFLEHILADPGVAHLMSDEELREESKSMVVAGQGTVAHSLSFVLLMLAMHPHVQHQVHQELDDIFGLELERPITEAELPHLAYLERVILETLRLFPLVPVFGRNCPDDTELPSGFPVPRGAHLLVCVFHTHRNAKWFHRPLEFDPDRFLPEQTRSRPQLSFAAFSAGPRSCIGQRYALMYLKTVLSAVLRRYQVHRAPGDQRSVQDLPLEIGVILNLAGGFPVRISHRHA